MVRKPRQCTTGAFRLCACHAQAGRLIQCFPWAHAASNRARGLSTRGVAYLYAFVACPFAPAERTECDLPWRKCAHRSVLKHSEKRQGKPCSTRGTPTYHRRDASTDRASALERKYPCGVWRTYLQRSS